MDIDEVLDLVNPNNCAVSPEEWEIIGDQEPSQEKLIEIRKENWFKRIKKPFGIKKIADVTNDFIETNINKKIDEVLKILQEKFPQYCLNGIRNLWIVKPAGLSRGRGIRIFNKLMEINDYTKNKEQQWVVQKYIEHPLVMMDRKVV